MPAAEEFQAALELDPSSYAAAYNLFLAQLWNAQIDRAREAAKWARYPPVARRSAGGGQAASLWGINGINYRQTINDNMLVVIMIETPTGVANAFDIASVPGVDVVIIGNNDLSSFSGFPQNDDRYQAMIKKVHDDTLRAGKIFGQAAANYAKGHPLSGDAKFFQNGPSNDGWVPPARGGRCGSRGAAPSRASAASRCSSCRPGRARRRWPGLRLLLPLRCDRTDGMPWPTRTGSRSRRDRRSRCAPRRRPSATAAASSPCRRRPACRSRSRRRGAA